jgi:ABC-type branched-subunit amino acid transport system ATPase component
MSLLVLRDVAAGYGDNDIVANVNLHVAAQEIVAVAGTNGSGKSTVVKAIMGLLGRVRGEISLDGKDLMKIPAEQRIRVGVSYVPQVANVFGTLSVDENLLVVEGVGNPRRRIAEMLELFPALGERRRTRAGALSGGERQQLAFARALMPEPKLMLLDEPTAGLSPALVYQVFELIKGLPALGVTVLLVEQRARQALEISDRGYILDQGRIVLDDDARKLLSDERMAELYLGRA